MNMSKEMTLNSEVANAITMGKPIVALESAVITHGLAYPTNVELARDMEKAVRDEGAIPATVALLDGKVYVGIDESQLEALAMSKVLYKISRRDFAPAIALRRSGGTTVAGTMIAARAAGIRVFATGGIGGVHRQAPFDVSPDLPELSRTGMIVVCAGAKSILDLPATLEYLETHGVPVLGYKTDEFPAFYSKLSGLKVHVRVDSAEEVASIARMHWDMGFESGVLVVVPPPSENALNFEEIEEVIEKALQEAQAKKISGQVVTPFLLEKVAELTGGESVKSNVALLLNNANVAAQIAKAYYLPRVQRV